MEAFQLTRKEMATLLKALKGENANRNCADILKEAWFKRYKNLSEKDATKAFMSTSLPTIFETLIKKQDKEAALSLNEIVLLGNQIEHTDLSLSTVQNWVKRDAKDLIGSPAMGKKYSIDQATILFIIDDLKNVLDFNSIRPVLNLMFRDPANPNDDLIDPITIFSAYSSIFEDLDPDGDQMIEAEEVDPQLAIVNKEKTLEVLIEKRATEFVNTIEGLTDEQKQIVQNTIVMLTLTIQISFLKSLAKTYANTNIFLLN
jgi:hypothetical protein